jgi:hypothetical protein
MHCNIVVRIHLTAKVMSKEHRVNVSARYLLYHKISHPTAEVESAELKKKLTPIVLSH